MDSVGEIVRGHLDAFSEQLLRAVAEQLDKQNASLEAHMRELVDEGKRLRTELCIEHGTTAMEASSADVEERELAGIAFDDKAITVETPVVASAPRPADVSKLSARFSRLDVTGAGVVNIGAVQEKLMETIVQDNAHVLSNFSSLVNAFRAGRPELFQGLQEDEISFGVFQELMLGEDVSWLDEEHVQTLNVVRSSNVYEDALGAIMGATSVCAEELAGRIVTDRLWWLEPFIGFVIAVNAAIVGLSLDIAPTSAAWKMGELICTLCFVLEFFLKLIVRGWLEYFFGSDWKWNLFDFVLVVLAGAEMGFVLYLQLTGQSHPSSINLRDFTVLRTTRLLRLARVAKLFKLKQMKELTLMVMGIIGGLRTLFWALFLLFIFVYILGIMSQQTMNDWKEQTPCDDSSFTCNEFEAKMYAHYGTMFGDLFKTSLTVFRCVTGDCSLPEGTPLAPILLETLGRGAVLWYLCCSLFVMVCVFNLIMAVFVENTLEYAKQDQDQAEQFRRLEQIQHARKLQQLVDKLVRHMGQPTDSGDNSRGLCTLWKYIPNKGFLASTDSQPLGYEVKLPTPFKVNRQAFEAAMNENDVDDILDDLEISLSSKAKLFDILDSDGDGVLNLHEIVDGIMRLRGPADKSDIVSNGLMIRSMQKQVHKMTKSIEDVQEALHATQSQSSAGAAQLLRMQSRQSSILSKGFSVGVAQQRQMRLLGQPSIAPRASISGAAMVPKRTHL